MLSASQQNKQAREDDTCPPEEAKNLCPYLGLSPAREHVLALLILGLVPLWLVCPAGLFGKTWPEGSSPLPSIHVQLHLPLLTIL